MNYCKICKKGIDGYMAIYQYNKQEHENEIIGYIKNNFCGECENGNTTKKNSDGASNKSSSC